MVSLYFVNNYLMFRTYLTFIANSYSHNAVDEQYNLVKIIKNYKIILILCWSGATGGSYASIAINVKDCTLEIITLNMIMS